MRFGLADLRALGKTLTIEIEGGHVDRGDHAAFDIDNAVDAAHVEAGAAARFDNAGAARDREFPMPQIPWHRPSRGVAAIHGDRYRPQRAEAQIGEVEAERAGKAADRSVVPVDVVAFRRARLRPGQ